MNFDRKKILYIFVSIIGVLVVSFLLYNVVGKADTDSNKIAIQKIKMTKIETGSGAFSSDGFDYSDTSSYQKVTGYTAGGDSNADNRLVRSFDTLTYNFDFTINGKNDNNDYEERVVNINVTLPDEVAPYVAFTSDSVAGEKTHTYSFDGIDTYGSFQKQVTLYVLGAPNGLEINPKFEIQESTNTDSNYLISLGNVASTTYYYEYDREASNQYRDISSVSGFSNYMPTIVSSKTANIQLKVLGQSNEGQKTTYNGKIGRYLTYVVGLDIVGNETTGIKGYTMPNKSAITFDVTASQNGSVNTAVLNNDWTRLYGVDNISGIESVQVALPYSSSTVEASKRTSAAGNISLSSNTATISDYDITYDKVKVNADASKISNSDYYIGTYAISVFSERTASDGKNDITTTLGLSNIKAVDTAGTNLSIPNASASIVNKYYENVDYSLTGSFYDQSGNKVSPDQNGKGAISKGTTLIYKTTFKYSKTLSEQGLKEVIKLDPNALRVVPRNNSEDIKIEIQTQDGNLSSDDFEVKYVTGSFDNSNYSANSTYSKVSSEDLSTITSTCSNVSRYLSAYTNDQIMNLYGGPCISAKANVESTFDKITDASDGETEIPITKVIVQTKNGVVLPDSVIVNIEVSVRVRNVSDLTQTYQMTAVATSSDYDTTTNYYAPRVTNDENSITSANNYWKTTYVGQSITGIDTDSPWGDCLKIVNFTSRQTITVTNKNTDGSVKTSYNVNKGETITYNIKTKIDDENMNVGADDVWWINNLEIWVTVPNELQYIPDADLDKYLVNIYNGDATTLVYSLPYTKPNMKIPEINFKASIKPTLKGSSVPITVTSKAEAVNINGEKDASYFGLLTSSFTIYATGIENVIVSQKVGENGSVVEKNSEFSYLLSAYNNTNNNITDYNIVDILPSPNDRNSSSFNGSYKVKVTLPASLGSAKVYCSTDQYQKLAYEVFNSNNEFEECDATEGYVNATAIRITDISINANSYMEDIKISLKAKDNEYEDKYINSFLGASKTYSENESNKIEIKVISRNISGRVFIDNNENGIEDKNDTYMENVPLTLYKLDSENNMTKIDDTVTNKNGYYKFKNLDVGRYKIRASYDKALYDLTLRYATEDVSVDSDAYKIEDGIVEISNKRIPDESDGIRVTREIESVSDMNIGLISRKSFGFDINKFITKVELTYNGNTTVKNYDNLKLVKEDVKQSWRASAKVYYGIKIDNNSTAAGYVKLINESIPTGSTFDENDPNNTGWFYINGELQNVSLENDLINPGESRYLTVVLDIPSQQEYRSYVNTVTLLNVEQYEPEPLAEDKNADPNAYTLGEALTYAGINWHVVNIDQSNGEQILTLLADSGTINQKMSHTSSNSDTYKWSTSSINSYINSIDDFSSINKSSLIDNVICDDASGLPVASYGGTLQSERTCQSNIYNSYKVRLLTENEFNRLKTSNLEDLSWLYGNDNFWLQNSAYIDQNHDAYGRITDATVVKNLAKFVNKSTTSVQTGYNSDINSWIRSTTKMEVRPVITISNKNIIAE